MEAVALKERENQIHVKGEAPFNIVCNKDSLAGAVSQRACVFCGSRVVLYPIADALHLVHGPIGCAVYTWDIRGALSSGPELHRLSFSTDLQERDVIFGGEKKLRRAGLDYREFATIETHASLEACLETLGQPRVFALSTRGTTRYDTPTYAPGDAFLLGPETRGLPQAVLDALPAEQATVLYKPRLSTSSVLQQRLRRALFYRAATGAVRGVPAVGTAAELEAALAEWREALLALHAAVAR